MTYEEFLHIEDEKEKYRIQNADKLEQLVKMKLLSETEDAEFHQLRIQELERELYHHSGFCLSPSGGSESIFGALLREINNYIFLKKLFGKVEGGK